MPPKLALLAAIGVILWLFFKERKSRAPLSSALWLPLIWAFIVGSKPVSMWLQGGSPTDATIDYLEGSPLDRLALFSLIAAGLLVLFQRRETWSTIIWNNKWVFAFYLYLGLSVLWSDYSFVSLKRWIKDFGNVVMALVVLSELNPVEAFKSVLLRCTFLLVPLSVVIIKYFPDIGRYYDRWTYKAYFSGVAGDKNLLGMLLFVCGLLLFHVFLSSRKQARDGGQRLPNTLLIALMLMVLWLLRRAQSVTAIVCTVFCACILFVLDRYGARKFVLYGLIFFLIVVSAASVLSVGNLVSGFLGRDTTLTGRTEIWTILMSQKVNPLLGVGFYSFWLGDRSLVLSREYNRDLNEAHNGYLEMYLNGGLIGLLLLMGLLGAAIRSQWNQVKLRTPDSAFRFSFLIGTILYNMTEATFNRLSIIWFTFLLIAVIYPRPHEEVEVEDASGFIPATETPGNLLK